ncbi:MAG: hypothetical protein RQ736_07910 [Thiogranum sp.]|nr:hypothetical protein [Thiogranum sp.]
MNTTRHFAMLGLALVVSAGQSLVSAQENEQDSVYSYGRWAVLSPAAGGIEPYVATDTPVALNNTRPEEPFGPTVLAIGIDPSTPPPVVVPPNPPPIIVPNPPGNPPPVGDPRPPVVVPNIPGTPPPVGDPRDVLVVSEPVVLPGTSVLPPVGDPRTAPVVVQ